MYRVLNGEWFPRVKYTKTCSFFPEQLLWPKGLDLRIPTDDSGPVTPNLQVQRGEGVGSEDGHQDS